MAESVDDFAAAFEEAATVADKTPVPTPGSQDTDPKKEEVAPKKEEVAPKKDEPELEDDPDAKAKADAEAEASRAKAKVDEAARIKDIKDRAKAEAEARREIEAEAAAKKAAEEAAVKKAAENTAFPDLEVSEDETAAIAALEKDWPEAHKAVNSILRQREHGIKKLFTDTLREVIAHVYKDIGALQGSAVSSEEDRHFSALSRANPDLDELIPPGKEDEGPLKQWVDSQPSIYKGALTRVYNEGTTAEMLELISTYRQATGKMTPGADPDAAAKAKEEAEVEKARKAAGLAPVPSKRTTVRTAQPDPNNFDAAFEEATAGEKIR